MINKDVTHAKMSRRLRQPRVILLDCPLEYKKGESQTSVEMSAETDFTKVRVRESVRVKIEREAEVKFLPRNLEKWKVRPRWKCPRRPILRR